MASERQRLLELALESLEAKKQRLDDEIVAVNRELRAAGGANRAAASGWAARDVPAGKRNIRITKEERLRRSRRMKAYWDKWRRERSRNK